MRKVICHYHIFKNSGVSFDAVLKENFDDRFLAFDGPFAYFSIDQDQLGKIIERNPEIVAFSSHQIRLPVPVSLDFCVLPVIFIRNPILRALSIYKFKRQSDDGDLTSKAALANSFEDWVRFSLSNRLEISNISNAQTQMLGAAYRQRALLQREPEMMLYDLDQAMRNLNNVELLARTEYFGPDVGRFSALLARHGIEFQFRGLAPMNVTSDNLHKPPEQRVADVQNMLSTSVFKKLVAANAQDLKLYDYASSLIEGN